MSGAERQSTRETIVRHVVHGNVARTGARFGAVREVCDWLMLALAGAAFFALGRRRNLSAFDVLLLVAGTVFAFRARRDLWFLVIASLAGQASGVSFERAVA